MLHLLAHSQSSQKSFAGRHKVFHCCLGVSHPHQPRLTQGSSWAVPSHSQTSPQRAEASSCSPANDSTERKAGCWRLWGGHLHCQPRRHSLCGILWTTSHLMSSAWYLLEPATLSHNSLARSPLGEALMQSASPSYTAS